MEKDAEISFSLTFKDTPEHREKLEAAVVDQCGLDRSDIADTPSIDLVRYILDSKSSMLLDLGVQIHDSSAQVITPSAQMAPGR